MCIALQSLYSQQWERGEKQMGFKFCLKCLKRRKTKKKRKIKGGKREVEKTWIKRR